jgi:ribonuclease P/MRP protein subunit RPP40
VLPEEIYEILKKEVLDELPKPTYSRVILPLKALLEGEFFNEYIKKGIWNDLTLVITIRDADLIVGNILMLSEGTLGVDNTYFLREGAFHLITDLEVAN